MAINYVKFQRGSQAAYDALLAARRIDENTLYFIYPTDKDASSVGKLYLGERLISGGDIVLTSASLSDLADVITNNIQTNDFLVAQKTTTTSEDGKIVETVEWKNVSLEQVTNLIKNGLDSITVEDDDVVILDITDNKITASHAKKGPEGGAIKGASADASLSNFGEFIEFKVPVVEVDEYGHTAAVDEKTISIDIPTLPEDKDTKYTLEYETITFGEDETGTEKKVIRLYDHSGEIVSEIDANEFIKDGMLEEVTYDASKNSLIFTWNTSAGKTVTEVELTDILSLESLVNELTEEKVDKEYENIPVIDPASGAQITADQFTNGVYYIEKNGKYVVATEYVENQTYYTQAVDEDGKLVFDKVEYTLLSPEEKEKLGMLVFDEDGGVSISGNVHISQVQGLDGYLEEKHFSKEVVDKLNSNFIEEVDEDHFTVNENKLLFTPKNGRLLTPEDETQLHYIENVSANFEIKPVTVGQDEDGKNITKNTLHLISVSQDALKPALGDLSSLPTIQINNNTSNTVVDNINNIYNILTWGEMTI